MPIVRPAPIGPDTISHLRAVIVAPLGSEAVRVNVAVGRIVASAPADRVPVGVPGSGTGAAAFGPCVRMSWLYAASGAGGLPGSGTLPVESFWY